MSLRDLILDTFASAPRAPALRARWLRLRLSRRAFARLLAVEDCASDLLVRLREVDIADRLGGELYAELADRAVRETARMLRMRAELRSLLDALRQRDAHVTLLKGAAYIVAGMRPHRPCGDIDLLCGAREVERVAAVLAELGYRPRDGNGECASHHLPQFDRARAAPVELHTRALARVVGASEQLFDLRQVEPSASVLSPTDWCWHTLAHEARHYKTSGRVRGALDIAALLERYGDEIDWSVVRCRAEHWPDSPTPVLQSVWRLGYSLPVRGGRRVRLPRSWLSYAREYAARIAATDDTFGLVLQTLGDVALLPLAEWRATRFPAGRSLGGALSSMARRNARLALVLLGRTAS